MSTTAPHAEIGAFPWKPDLGDGTYKNPIICADYPDPDVIRDGDDYFMVVSSFNLTPGLPILHSRDLVNWAIVNHAVDNLPGDRFAEVQAGAGVWAPSIRKRAGKFWIFFPMPDEGIYVTTADHPSRAWSKPQLVQEGKGLIDPCPLWDDDGKAYLVHAYARSRAGIKSKLRVRPMAPDGSKLLGEGQLVYDDPEHQPTLEGPKFMKRDGYYYILAPAGGVDTGWQLALRSKDIYGPYEPRKILEQGSTPINGPHQGALIDTAGGDWWFVHFQQVLPYGRITHLQPAGWKDGWPYIGIDLDGNGIGEPVARHAKPRVAGAQPVEVPETSDEFEGRTLGLQWHWYANHQPDWLSLDARPGWARLYAQPAGTALNRTANALTQKFPAGSFTVETKVELASSNPGQRAGLAVIGNKSAALLVQRTAHAGAELVALVEEQIVERRVIDAAQVTLSIVVNDGACTFAYAPGDTPMQALSASFRAMEGQWIGAMIGLISTCASDEKPTSNQFADFGYLRFSPAQR